MKRWPREAKQKSYNAWNYKTDPDWMRVEKTISLFDEMIAKIADGFLSQSQTAEVPSESLQSLLDRCIQIASQPEVDFPELLVAFPGLPELDPDWWTGHAAGIKVCYLPELKPVQEFFSWQSMARKMQQKLTREGRDLLLLATPLSLAHGFSASFVRTRLLICHPWQAYAATGLATGHSLDGFCAALSERVADLGECQVIRYEEAGESRAERINVLLGRQPPPERPSEHEGDATDYVDGSPAYEALCAQLNYAPNRLPSSDWLLAGAKEVSFTLPESRVLEVSMILPRVRSLLPTDNTSNAIYTLLPQLDAAVLSDDIPGALDAIFSTLHGEDCALAMLLAAAHFTFRGETLQAVGLITDALEIVPPHAQGLVALGASLYVDLNKCALALEALASGLLRSGVLPQEQAVSLGIAVRGEADKILKGDHGHALLIARLRVEPPLPLSRRRLMVEIGTTRENVPEQGSTRKLACLCTELGIDFVTVDMDPANSRRARRMFKRLKLPFRAITAKGEEFLAAHPGPIDYVFLDAYDFDHGHHSELRQSRYKRFLGDRIKDAGCHKMHLDCAQSLLSKLSDDGLICLDDTWNDGQGNWCAKGTTAMPFLIGNGFDVIDARNRAVLLARLKRASA